MEAAHVKRLPSCIVPQSVDGGNLIAIARLSVVHSLSRF